MKKILNQITLKVLSKSVNEKFARASIASFCVQADPSLDEITDIKTAVSEAVTNAVVHAYPGRIGWIELGATLFEDRVEIIVKDFGVGIQDIARAREPFFTTKPAEERSGMGFTVMESFMDAVEVVQNSGDGISVKLTKKFAPKQQVAVGE